MTQLKIAASVYLLTFTIQNSRSASRSENEACQSVSRDESKDFRVIVASHVPDHHSLLPTVCETCTWLPQSYSGLVYGRRRVSVDSWPVHGRCRESSRVLPPVRPKFRDSCSSRQMWLWHLSLAFSKFAEGCLPHEAGVPDIPYALPVTGSGTRARRKRFDWP